MSTDFPGLPSLPSRRGETFTTEPICITDSMLDRAVEAYRPSSQSDRRTTREAMRDALEAALRVEDGERGEGA